MTQTTIRARTQILAIAAISGFLGLTFIDQVGIAIVLPALKRDLGLDETGLDWVMNAFFLTLAVLLLAAGRIADIVGARRIFAAGLALFAASSLVAAVTGDGLVEILARAVQGCGTAAMFATYTVLLARIFPRERLGSAIGTCASLASLFLAIGPMLAAMLAEAYSWRAVFLINMPLCGLIGGCLKVIPPDPVTTPGRCEGLDPAGAGLWCIGAAALVIGLMELPAWGPGRGCAAAFGVAAVALSGFVAVQARSSSPLLDLSLLRNRSFVAGNVVLMSTQVLVVAVAFWSVWLQVSLGFDMLHAGLLLLPTGLPIVVLACRAGAWADRVGPAAPIRTGTVLCLASAIVMAVATAARSEAAAVTAMLLYGVGTPLVISPAIKTVMHAAPPDRLGVASGALNTMRQLGAALCFGVVGSIVTVVERRDILAAIPPGLRASLGRQVDAMHLLAVAGTDAGLRGLARSAYAHGLSAGMCAVAVAAACGTIAAWRGLPAPRRTAAMRISNA